MSFVVESVSSSSCMATFNGSSRKKNFLRNAATVSLSSAVIGTMLYERGSLVSSILPKPNLSWNHNFNVLIDLDTFFFKKNNNSSTKKINFSNDTILRGVEIDTRLKIGAGRIH